MDMRHEGMPRALLALLLALLTILGGSPGLAGDGVSSEWVEAPVEEKQAVSKAIARTKVLSRT